MGDACFKHIELLLFSEAASVDGGDGEQHESVEGVRNHN